MRIKFTLLVLFLALLSAFKNDQNSSSPKEWHPVDKRPCKATFGNIDPDGRDIKSFLEDYLPGISNKREVKLKLTHEKESPVGKHYTFQQYYRQIPVYRSQVKVNVDQWGNIRSIFDNSHFIPNRLSESFPDTNLAGNLLTAENISTDQINWLLKERNYFFDGSNLIPVVRVEVSTVDHRYLEFVYNNYGQVIYRNDLNSYMEAKMHDLEDTLVKVAVFNPDPLTSAQKEYGGGYIDNNDSDHPNLNNELQIKTINASIISDSFRLVSPVIIFMESSSPVTPHAVSYVPEFFYTRNQPEFEEVNIYYHINTFQDYLQSIGFNEMSSYQIRVDAHALNGSDQSQFDGGVTPARLLFGDGGVDDGEDADVIIHEYSHAISNVCSPKSNSGNERRSLDEGLCDYFAMSYSRSLSNYNWDKVFNWDGHNEYWEGRVVVKKEKYPEALTTSIYKNAEIWSSAITEVWETLGKKTTDKLMLQTLYGLAKNMTFAQAAELFLQADTLMYNHAHARVISEIFCARGLLDSCILDIAEPQVWNMKSFSHGNGKAIVKFNEYYDVDFTLFDLNGKVIYRESVNDVFEYHVDTRVGGLELPAGIYVASFSLPTGIYNLKLVKFE